MSIVASFCFSADYNKIKFKKFFLSSDYFYYFYKIIILFFLYSLFLLFLSYCLSYKQNLQTKYKCGYHTPR